MSIVVPSRGRCHMQRQWTAEHLRKAEIPFTYFLSIADPHHASYPTDGSTRVLVNSQNYSEKCQAILDYYGDRWHHENGKFYKIDDDLDLMCVGPTGLTTPATSADWRALMAMMEDLLDTYPLVGVSDRFMINSKAQPIELNTRARAFVGVNTRLLGQRESWPRYDRLSTLQDVDFQFQVYEKTGRDVAVITKYCFKEGLKSWSEGGASAYRTEEVNKENHYKLRDLWPDFVALEPGKLGGVKSRIQMKKAAKTLKARFVP